MRRPCLTRTWSLSLTRRNWPPPTPNPDFIQKMKPDFSEAGMDFILSICGKGRTWRTRVETGDLGWGCPPRWRPRPPPCGQAPAWLPCLLWSQASPVWSRPSRAPGLSRRGLVNSHGRAEAGHWGLLEREPRGCPAPSRGVSPATGASRLQGETQLLEPVCSELPEPPQI